MDNQPHPHATLDKDEKVMIKQRKHWFVFVLDALGFFIAAFLPFIVFPLIDWIFPQVYDFFGQGPAFALFLFVGLVWLVLVWIMFFIAFTNYYLDILVVTNKRLIDIDQLGLFSRDIATIPFENIQDIKIQTIGIIPTLLKYGNIYIQTAGKNEEVIIRGIAHPERVKAQILKIYQNIGVTEED